MIQAKVTPQEMIGKLTQMGLSEEQAISAVKMVASKLNGGQEQPEKMQNGDAIQPAPGYEFSQRSVNANGGVDKGLLDSASRSGYSNVIQDKQGNWTAELATSRKIVPITIGSNGTASIGNRAYDW